MQSVLSAARIAAPAGKDPVNQPVPHRAYVKSLIYITSVRLHQVMSR